VRVELGYNLNEIEEDINIEEVATRIIPTGYNGIMLDSSTPWVDSPLINKYTKPKMRVINFDDVKVKESETDEEGFNTIEEARAELVKRCNKLYEEGIDKPSVNYKIDMINLANTTAYKDYIKLVTVNEGDTVTCYIPGLDIDVKARVIDFVKDLITGEYISLELGNVQNNFFNNQADLQNRVNSILNSNGTVKADMLNGAINALDTKFKAQRDIAQPQQVRAMLFEDRVEGSPTFGCMCIGTMGFEIADGFKPGTEEWDFRTFGTGAGFVADCIVAGTLRAIVLESMDGSCKIDLGDGIVNISKGIIKGLNSEWNLNTGTFRTEKVEPYGTYSIEIGAGRIYSGNLLDVKADNGMNFSADNFAWFKRDGGGSIMSLGVENRRFDVVMDRIYL
ncbi:MAG: phage tail spike protein, partial [Clostridium paraputrificum]